MRHVGLGALTVIVALAVGISTLASTPPADAAGGRPKVVLDPDHGYANLTSPDGNFNGFPISLSVAQAVQAQLPNVCAADIVIAQTTDGGAGAGSRAARAAQMADADLSVTLSMNSAFGVPWGFDPAEGGTSSFATNRADNLAFGNELVQSISAATGRPLDLVNTGPTNGTTYPYAEYGGLSGTYAQVFMLFIDNNFDIPIWRDNPQFLVDGLVTAIGHTLEAKGFPCLGSYPALPTAAALQRLRNLGYQNFLRYAADPISMSTGNFTTSEEVFSLTGVGNQAIDLTLNYNAQSGEDSPVGVGWQFAYGSYIQQYNDGSVGVFLPDGRALLYESDGGGGFTSPAGSFASLTQLDATTFRWTTTTQTALTFTQDPTTGRGVLTGTLDRQGNTETLTYGASGALFPSLATITDQAGQQVVVGTNSDGRITSFARPGGGVWQLAYSPAGDLISITTPRETTRQFGYDAEHRMTSEVGQDGVTFLTNAYDGQSRVVSQTSAFGGTRTIVYDDSAKRTSYTDTTGATTTYHWNDLGQVTKVVDALGGETSTTYNTELLPQAETNPLDQVTGRTYDASGQPAAITDPLGNVVSSSYNATGDLTGTSDEGGPSGGARAFSHSLNGDGLPTSTTNPDGSTVQRVFNAAGDVTSVTNETGDTTAYEYDARGNTTKVTDPLGRATTMSYDLANRLTGVTDALGRSTSYSYDANDNLTSIGHPNGSTEQRTYDVNDSLKTSTDRRGATTSFAYDAELNLKKVTLPNGGTIIHTYDGESRLTSTTNPLGDKTTFSIDELGRRVAATDANGHQSKTTYDLAGRIASESDSSGATTSFTTDANGRILTATDPLGGVTTNVWDKVGRLTKVTDPLGHATSFTYNFRDQVLSTTDPAGGVATNEYDAAGRLVAQTDAVGAETSFAYDEAGQLTRITDALGGETEFTYDLVGNEITVTDPNGHITKTAYNTMNEAISSTDATNKTWSLTRDAGGLVTATADPLGNTTTATYDTMGNRTSSANGLGRVTQFGFDLASQQVSETAADGVITANSFDPVGNLLSVTRNKRSAPANASTNVVTSYTYDSRDLLSSVTDPNGAVTTYGYDAMGRRTTETNPVGNITAFSYDLAGNQATRTDGNGKLTTYTYDERNLLTGRAYEDGSFEVFSYDAAGRQLTAKNKNGTVTTSYDLLGRATSVIDANGKKLTYSYDAAGNRTGLKLPDGKTISYQYDPADRLIKQTSPLGVVTTAYDAAGRTTLVGRPNGTTTRSSYDAAHQLTSEITAKGSKAVAGFAYTYDTVGNVASRVQTGVTSRERLATTYQYDPLRRLTASRGGLLPSDYTYDAAGNRLTWTAPKGNQLLGLWPVTREQRNTYNAAGQLTNSRRTAVLGLALPLSDSSYGYDANGNRIFSESRLGNTPIQLTRTAYTYDFENRLVAAGPASPSGKPCDVQVTKSWPCALVTAPLDWLRDAQTRRYDALGRLTSETNGKFRKTTAWVNDGLDPVIATEKKPTLFVRDGEGDLVGQKVDKSDPQWFVNDALGSIVTTTNKSGSRSLTPIYYSDYGVTLGNNPLRFGFTGEMTDPEQLPDLQQYYARAYEPWSGSWLQADPFEGLLGSPETQAAYQYVGGNPTSNVDLLGMLSVGSCCSYSGTLSVGNASPGTISSVGNANPGRITSVGVSDGSWNGGPLQSGNNAAHILQPTITAQQLQPTYNPYFSRVPAAKGQISRLLSGADLQGSGAWVGGATVPWSSGAAYGGLDVGRAFASGGLSILGAGSSTSSSWSPSFGLGPSDAAGAWLDVYVVNGQSYFKTYETGGWAGQTRYYPLPNGSQAQQIRNLQYGPTGTSALRITNAASGGAFIIQGATSGYQQWASDEGTDYLGGQKFLRSIQVGGGAAVGGVLGGAAGAACGPLAFVCVPAGSVVGGAAGAAAGSFVNWAIDRIGR